MKSSLRFLEQHVLPVVCCFGLALLLTQTDLVQRFESVTFDLRTKLRMQIAPRLPSGEVILIAIDEDSLREFGWWPWRRNIHGDFLQYAGTRKPAVIGWDILFTEPMEDDPLFVKGLTRVRAPVVLGATRAPTREDGVTVDDEASKNSRLQPLPDVRGDKSQMVSGQTMLLPAGSLAELAHLGFVDSPAEHDGARRRVPLVVRIGDKVFPSLSLKSLMIYWMADPDQVHVRLGEAIIIETERVRRRIPIDANGCVLINYRYGLKESVVMGYSDVYQAIRARVRKVGDAPPPVLIGRRILLVGQTAEALTDIGPTPMSPATPLVFVHANVIENILLEDYARRLAAMPIWIAAVALGIIGSVGLADRKLRELGFFALGVPVAYGLATCVAWNAGSWVLPLVGPLIGFCGLQTWIVGRRVLLEQRAKEQIKGMFGTYLSPALVNRLVSAGEMPRLGGHEVNLTAYFSDIQGFSTFSEILPPEKLVELMNEYLTACTDIVQEEGGTLDKYIGDAVVAMFGAPIDLPDHAYRACLAAARVQQKLGELRAKWRAESDKWPAVIWQAQTRIGLNTGPCVVGNMGSRSRFNYTMMGDNVNLAARMESGAKTWGVYTMCTEATKLACEARGSDAIVFRPLGRIVVMGRSQPVPIYEIMGQKGAVSDAVQDCIGFFNTAMGKFYARDWRGAAADFQRAAALEPNQADRSVAKANPSLVYLDRCAQYEQHPPAGDWDGRYVMLEK